MEQIQFDNLEISKFDNESDATETQLSNRQINESSNQLILFAACDCTGHGVPGALVSVVCSNALNRAVKEFALTTPAEILDKVNELVKENFINDDDVKDGMDASICSLNTDTGELIWAGANNALWIVKNAKFKVQNETLESGTVQAPSPIGEGWGEVIEIKPNKQPIGKFDNVQPFTNHKIDIQKGDTIYLFTDGYADQFGGPRGKKLGKTKFKEIVLAMQHLSMDEQRKHLLDFHLTWRGTQEQVDDICVIGVRV